MKQPNFMIGDKILLKNGQEAKIIEEYNYDTEQYIVRINKKVIKITENEIQKII